MADLGDEENFNLMRQGSVRLVLKFSQALATTVTVLVYAEFENVTRSTETETSSTTWEHEW